MRRVLTTGVFLLLLAGSPAGLAQPASTQLVHAAGMARDLPFPDEPVNPAALSAPRMALLKPDGPGPFPALVLQHQCGGLGNARWQNRSMLEWARRAVERGYVALLVDSLGPRGVESVCMGPRGGVNLMRGVRDAHQAAEHLRRFDFVDKERVALAGFSWGAMIGVLASSRHWGNSVGYGSRFAAVVSLYPGCFTIRPPGSGAYEIVNNDIDRPLLVLMGEKDNETPADECVSRLEGARANGAPVEWHVYPGLTHCWDCESLDGFSKVDFRGNHVVYRYDRDATEDASRRVFDFLRARLALPARPQ